MKNISLLRDDGGEWSARIMDTLKAGKFDLKSDYKVNCLFCILVWGKGLNLSRF